MLRWFVCVVVVGDVWCLVIRICWFFMLRVLCLMVWWSCVVCWGVSRMLSELEIRNIICNQREQLEQVVDPHERKVCGAFIAGLECALNE